MFDEKTRNAIRAEPGRLRQRPRRPRPAAQRRLRRPARAWSKAASRLLRDAGRAEHRLRRLLARRWRPSRPRSRRSPRRRRACSSPSTAPSPPSPASPAPTSRKRSSKGPPTLDAVDRRPAGAASLPPRLRTLLHRAASPGAKALGETSPMIAAAAARRHPGAQPSPVLNAQLHADRRSAARLPGSAGRLQRPRPADRHQRSARSRRSGSSPRPRPPATTSTLTFRNLANASQRRQRPGQLAQRDRLRAAGRPEQRERPGLGPANGGGPNRENHLHYNPYPNTASPGQDEECEAGNEHYVTGKTVIGNAPEQLGHRRPAGSSKKANE